MDVGLGMGWMIRRVPLPPRALGLSCTVRSNAAYNYAALTLLHAMVLLLGTASGQGTCHGIIDSPFCLIFYNADPDNFCGNQ